MPNATSTPSPRRSADTASPTRIVSVVAPCTSSNIRRRTRGSRSGAARKEALEDRLLERARAEHVADADRSRPPLELRPQRVVGAPSLREHERRDAVGQRVLARGERVPEAAGRDELPVMEDLDASAVEAVEVAVALVLVQRLADCDAAAGERDVEARPREHL